MSAAKKVYYYLALSGFGVFGVILLYLALDTLLDREWLLAALLGGISLFIGWIFIQLLKLPQQKGPTTFTKVEEKGGYILYFANEWTGETKAVTFHYDQITDLLIGLWTNPGFKGRKNDYIGARLLYRYREENGDMKYSETVIISEPSLEEWVKTIKEHQLPAKLSNKNISAIKEDQFDEMLETIEAIPFDGSISVKDYFMQQEDFSLWQPPSMKQGNPPS
jgi:hypothetical protein